MDIIAEPGILWHCVKVKQLYSVLPMSILYLIRYIHIIFLLQNQNASNIKSVNFFGSDYYIGSS